jgi:hypothetical protein
MSERARPNRKDRYAPERSVTPVVCAREDPLCDIRVRGRFDRVRVVVIEHPVERSDGIDGDRIERAASR